MPFSRCRCASARFRLTILRAWATGGRQPALSEFLYFEIGADSEELGGRSEGVVAEQPRRRGSAGQGSGRAGRLLLCADAFGGAAALRVAGSRGQDHRGGEGLVLGPQRGAAGGRRGS